MQRHAQRNVKSICEEERREIVQMYLDTSMPFKEIAKIFDTSPAVVGYIVVRGTKRRRSMDYKVGRSPDSITWKEEKEMLDLYRNTDLMIKDIAKKFKLSTPATSAIIRKIVELNREHIRECEKKRIELKKEKERLENEKVYYQMLTTVTKLGTVKIIELARKDGVEIEITEDGLPVIKKIEPWSPWKSYLSKVDHTWINRKIEDYKDELDILDEKIKKFYNAEPIDKEI